MPVSFNRPYATGREADYIRHAIALNNIGGNGLYTEKCEAWLETRTGCAKAMLTPSCTGALEMAAMLIATEPGDEIIMPSYAFVSTANAFAMQGGVPVFVDIRPDTYTLDDRLIEAAITARTKAIVLLHYAGVGCNVDAVTALARKHKLYLIEDNAHGILAQYGGKPLGSFGHLAAISFHETKNVTCGQGGALLINDASFTETAYVLRDKGTNRQAFERGLTPFYSWVGQGSNYSLSELQAAFLWAQFEAADAITRRRAQSWLHYRDAFAAFEQSIVQLPVIPERASLNGHIFPLLLRSQEERDRLIGHLAAHGIAANFHYVPLHLSPGYRRFGRLDAPLPVTEKVSAGLLRLPLWLGIEPHQDEVIRVVSEWLSHQP